MFEMLMLMMKCVFAICGIVLGLIILAILGGLFVEIASGKWIEDEKETELSKQEIEDYKETHIDMKG